mgnify:CR=1 FL=1
MLRLVKPWTSISTVLDGSSPTRVHGEMGVYQLADGAGDVIFIGYAGGRSPFGLRGEIAAYEKYAPDAVSVRVEVTTAYLSRYQELLKLHVADHGALPRCNPPLNLGRLSPA